MRNWLLIAAGVAALSCGWLGMSGLPLLAAFVPLLWVVDREPKFWRAMRWALVTLAAWSLATTWWIAAVPGGWTGAVLSPLIQAVLFGAVFAMFLLVRKVSAAAGWAALTAGWIAAEWLYSVGEVSFPWLTLGNGFGRDVWAVQWYAVTGVWGGTLWVWLCNILIFNVLKKHTRWWWAAGAVMIPLLTSLIIYNVYTPPTGAPEKVALVQPNIFPFDKYGAMTPEQQMQKMIGLAGQAPADVDYIVFPETAVDNQLDDRVPDVAAFRELLAEKYPAAKMIIGATTMKFFYMGEEVSTTAREMPNGGFYDIYNSVLVVDTTAHVQVRHKSKLVVGVEKMPYAGRLKWMDGIILQLGGTMGTLGTDPEPKVFEEKEAVAVCWEGLFGEYLGEFSRMGAQTLFIISNDSWWGDTPGYKQLLRYSQLRAIELRRSVARCANTGLSAFITPRGDVVSQTKWDEAAVLTGTITPSAHVTFYARFGDYIARIAVFTLALTLLYSIAIFFKSKQ